MEMTVRPRILSADGRSIEAPLSLVVVVSEEESPSAALCEIVDGMFPSIQINILSYSFGS